MFGGGAPGAAPSQTPTNDFPIQQERYHVPAGSGQPIHLQTAINLDGKTIARSVSKHLAALNTHPRQAPYSDYGHGYAALDGGRATG